MKRRMTFINSISGSLMIGMAVLLVYAGACSKDPLAVALHDNAFQPFYFSGTCGGSTGSCEGVSHKWFVDITEYGSNPIVSNSSERRYYGYVMYDGNAFGNRSGQDIDGAGSGTDTYTVNPYYKMWVGVYDGSTFWTNFLYSGDGISWIQPAVGIKVVDGHYHPTVLYNVGGVPGYRMWDWDATRDLHYYTSSDGVSWVRQSGGDITPTSHTGDDFDNPSSPVYDICIIYSGATYYGWINNNGLWYLMTSSDAMSWYNTGHCTLTGSTETGHYFNTDGRAWVILRGGKYEMWFSSNENGDFTGDRRGGISYAESTDGLNFTSVDTIDYKGTEAKIAGPAENAIFKISDGVAWRNKVTYSPMVIYNENKFSGHGECKHYKMYFAGDSTDTGTYPERSVGYLSFNKPCSD